MTQTSTTPETIAIAAGLSTAMQGALLTGIDTGGRVVGKVNTMNALADRGLITDGHRRANRRPSTWTKLGREVARALDSSVMTLDELHAVALTEDAERFPKPTDIVVRSSDNEEFTANEHVTVEGIPGVTWLVTEVYPAGTDSEPSATVWASPASGFSPRLVSLSRLTHVDPTRPEPAKEQESAYPAPDPAVLSEYVNTLAGRLMQVIQEVRAPEPPPAADPVQTDVPDELLRRIVRRAQYLALREVLTQLDGWVAGMKSNHEALDHRDRDCCDTFHPADIRGMVNDAARQLNLPTIP